MPILRVAGLSSNWNCKKLEQKLSHLKEPITLSIIGCVVNGPGEAAQTEVGLTGGGQDNNLLYLSGIPHAKVASTEIIDKDGNQILVEMFKYFIDKNMFFSKGKIQIKDINNNNYNFSEIYIDEKNKKIVGSDVKAFLNQEGIKINKDNEPRFFANTMTLTKEKNEISKGVFTYCKNRDGEKCPPWILQSKKLSMILQKKQYIMKMQL